MGGEAQIPICVTFFDKLKAWRPSQFKVQQFSVHEFVTMMRRLSKEHIADKEKRGVFSPTVFKCTGRHFRTIKNFHRCYLLPLDIDGGTVTPEMVEGIFWHNAGRGQKRPFIICNSFSARPEDPNRFRVFFFLREPCRSIAEYHAVFDDITERLRESAFPHVANIDMQLRSGVQPIFLPCTNRAYPEYAFFESYGTQTDEIEKYAIKPSNYLLTAKREHPVSTEAATVRVNSTNAARRETNSACTNGTARRELSPKLEAEKQQLMAMKEGRRRLFFVFSRKLNRFLNGDIGEIRRHLYEVAGNDRGMQQKAKVNLETLQRRSFTRKINEFTL